MKLCNGSIWLFTCLLGLTVIFAQPTYSQDDKKEEPVSEGLADTLKRMQIKRAEAEHKKLIKSAQQAAEIAEKLPTDVSGEKLDHAAEKRLKEIEKAAKQIRNSVGSSNDEKEFVPPKDLKEAVERMVETSKHLSEQMEKTSRHLISATILVTSNDMLRLVKILRGYL